MPRLQARPARSASSVLGRMPAAITTRSAGITSPSLNCAAQTRPSPLSSSAAVWVLRRNWMPRASRALCSSWPAVWSSWRSSSQEPMCTTVTSMPRSLRPLAASRPSRPPPITSAWRWVLAVAIIISVSAMSR
ncbi:hypothetical protein D3C80_1029130 [compost metagenome]